MSNNNTGETASSEESQVERLSEEPQPDNPISAAALEEPLQPQQPAVEEPPQPEQPPSEAKKSRGGWIVWVLFLCLLLAGLGGGAWWLYHDFFSQLTSHRQASEQAASQQQVNAERLAQLKSRLEEEQRARQSETAGLQNRVDELTNRLNSQTRRLQELSGTTRTDWLLAEAEYLIRLGIQRFITERNTANAIVLMESADQILKELDEVDLLPVRRALARDITTLRMLDNIDREGLYLKLNALGEAVMTLPLVPVVDETETQPVDASEMRSWQQRLGDHLVNTFARLRELIRVERRAGPIQPLLNLEEEAYIRHNLRFMLEQAQLALLREEPVVYRESLKKASGWLRDYFQLGEQTTRLLAELEALEEVQIQSEYPAVTGGLAALQGFIDSRHNRYIIESDADSPQPVESQP